MHALNDRHGRLDESGEWHDSADPRPTLLPSMLYSLATKELVQNGELSLIFAAAEPGSPYPAVLQQAFFAETYALLQPDIVTPTEPSRRMKLAYPVNAHDRYM